ncbi:MAG: acyl--CoA ligase [Gammaproteobacteria bacterium]|nr:acyl--CoA ligase [Gammaproteobacteria bacterium]
MTNQGTDLPDNLGNLLARAGVGERTVFIDLRRPDAIVEISANDFDQRVKSFARGLKSLGIKAGDRVGFLSQNRWEMLVGYFGSMYIGAVSVPINHKFPAKTIAHIVADANVALMFSDEIRRPLVPSGTKIVGFDDVGADGYGAFVDPGEVKVFSPSADDIAEILYTSGSTGMPKGVPLNHQGQLWALSKFLEPLNQNSASQRSLIVAPFYHMNALFYSSVHLLNGVTIICQPQFDAASYVDAIARYQCTHLSGVPSIFAMVAALDSASRPANLSSVKRIGIGSAPLSTALLQQVSSIFPSAQISNSYGTTEAGPAIFSFRKGEARAPSLSVGYPLDDVQWRLAGGASSTQGVFDLKTNALTNGYLNRPDADAERFEDGWFKTNDIMRRDADGFFYFVSRADDMFVCGGENIFPGEVEGVLNRHPAVQQSVVVGAPDDIKGMVPVAFVVRMSDTETSESEIKNFCIETGPVYAHPRAVVFKRSLPVGGTHKVDRRALEDEAMELVIALGRAAAIELSCVT